MEALISEIQIYEDKKPYGQWLKSIKFRFQLERLQIKRLSVLS